jgi:hypothetical protein
MPASAAVIPNLLEPSLPVRELVVLRDAHATLNGGKTAEIKLARFPGMTDEPAVLKNVKYWGTPRNDGFVMMPNEIETYREGPKAYEFKGTNGFMLTFDMTSRDVPAPKGSSMNY